MLYFFKWLKCLKNQIFQILVVQSSRCRKFEGELFFEFLLRSFSQKCNQMHNITGQWLWCIPKRIQMHIWCISNILWSNEKDSQKILQIILGRTVYFLLLQEISVNLSNCILIIRSSVEGYRVMNESSPRGHKGPAVLKASLLQNKTIYLNIIENTIIQLNIQNNVLIIWQTNLRTEQRTDRIMTRKIFFNLQRRH